MASQIGLFFISFGIKLICLCKQLPVYMFGALPGIVNFVFRKFGRKAVKGAFMDAADKAFHNLICQ